MSQINSAIRARPASPSTPDVLVSGLQCDSTVFVGAIVRVDAITGDVVNAQADNIENCRNTIGICQAKSSTTMCTVRLFGLSTAIYSGLTINALYFLSASTPGDYTTTPPTGSGEVVLNVFSPLTDDRVIVNIKSAIIRA